MRTSSYCRVGYEDERNSLRESCILKIMIIIDTCTGCEDDVIYIHIHLPIYAYQLKY